MRAGLHIAACCGLALGASTCHISLAHVQLGPLTFEVTLVSGDAGTADSELAFGGTHEFTFNVRAVDHDGTTAAFNGPVRVAVAPNGRLTAGSPTVIQLVDGRVDGVVVGLEKIHGDVSVWFEDIADDDDTPAAEERAPSWATGLSPVVHVSNPSIRGATLTDDIEASALEGDHVEVDVLARVLVATGTTQNGFYVTDLTEPSFGSIFVFTFSAPRGVEPGVQITQLSGTLEEFYGLTELAFPSYKVGLEVGVPDPTGLTVSDVSDDLFMESLEGALVEVSNVTVCAPGPDFQAFGQWVVLLDSSGSCSSGDGGITILSAFTVPSFDPSEHVDELVASIKGNLRFHVAAQPQWIINPREESDLAL